MRQIVIVGSGFAGLHIAQQLADEFSSRRGLALTVVTDRSHFLFTPLWTSVAAGTSKLSEIAIPLRKILPKKVRLVVDRVTEIDLETREVVGERHRYPYHFLVLAVGAQTDWHGNPQMERYTRPCRSGRDAVDIDEAVKEAMERAGKATDAAERRRALTFTVAGGGPTGVELMAKIASRLEQEILPNVSARIASETRLILAEPQRELLPDLDPDLRPFALEHLRRAGVDVRLGESVVDCSQGRVELSGGDAFESDTVMWCGGVRPPLWLGESGLDVDLQGRVLVHRSMQAAGIHNVYVAGDIASTPDQAPMHASVAVAQAETVARNIVADLSGRSRRDWQWDPAGTFVSLGRTNAVVNVGGMVLQGRPAQAVWAASYARLLPGGLQRLAMFPTLFGDTLAARSASSSRLLTD